MVRSYESRIEFFYFVYIYIIAEKRVQVKVLKDYKRSEDGINSYLHSHLKLVKGGAKSSNLTAAILRVRAMDLLFGDLQDRHTFTLAKAKKKRNFSKVE